jgi:mannose-1-phosphate guanylyltransferase
MPFYGFEVPFQWIDIGSIGDLWRASRLVLNGEVNGYKMPGRETRPGIWTGINTNIEWDKIEISGPVYIGSSSKIETGAKITGPTVIGSNCYIQAGAIIDQCLIDDYTRIGGIARLKEKIIYGSNCISLTGESLDIEKTDIGFIIDDARKELDMSEHHKLIFEFASELDHYK